MKRFLPFVVFLFLLNCTAFAQFDAAKSNAAPEETTYVIKTVNGTEYLAKILSDDGREVFIETNTVGKLYLKKTDIVSMQKVIDKADVEEKIAAGNYKKPYTPEGIFTTRYVFTTNALPIKKGENYATTNFHGPEIHFSVTDKLNAGIMTSWIGSPLILALKYTFSKEEDKVKFALGTLLGTSGFLNQGRGYMGLHWGCATIGDRENNLSFSAGVAYFNIGNTVSRLDKPYGSYSYTTSRVIEYGNNGTTLSQTTTNQGTPVTLIPGQAAKTVVGPMIGIAGIKKIGARSSFVLDNMLYVYKHEYLAHYSSFDYNSVANPTTGGTTVTNSGTDTYVYGKGVKTVLILMPGLRFQSSPKTATQIALPIIQVYGVGNRMVGGTQAKFLAFPAPMLTLFFKL